MRCVGWGCKNQRLKAIDTLRKQQSDQYEQIKRYKSKSKGKYRRQSMLHVDES